jgi:hypothetical protein
MIKIFELRSIAHRQVLRPIDIWNGLVWYFGYNQKIASVQSFKPFNRLRSVQAVAAKRRFKVRNLP